MGLLDMLGMGGPEPRGEPVDDKGRDPLRPVSAGAGGDER